MSEFVYKIYIGSDLVCEVKSEEYIGMIVSGIFAKYYADPDVRVLVVRSTGSEICR